MLGKVFSSRVEAVDFAKRFDDLGIDFRKRVEQREPEVAQSHANFIVDRGFGQAHFVGLPERSDFGADIVFAFLRFFRGKGKAVETFQLLRDAPALQQDCLPRDFGGMRREHRSDRDLPSAADGFLRQKCRLLSCAAAFREKNRAAPDVRGPVSPRGGGACGGSSPPDSSVRNMWRMLS